MAFAAPDETELIHFFGTAPSEAAPKDGYWSYEVRDERGVAIRFSFDLFERSVQTAIQIHDAEVALVSQEGASRMTVVKGPHTAVLRCEFSSAAERAVLELKLQPVIHLQWFTLRDV